MNTALRVALFCGLVPLVAGTAAFLVWVTTRSDALASLGLWFLAGGALLFLIGVVAIGRYFWLVSRAPDSQGRSAWGSGVAAGLLLLANLPAAGAIFVAAVELETRYTLTIRNRSSSPIQNVRISGGGVLYDRGIIPPGLVVGASFHFANDGVLTLEGTLGGKKLVQTLEPYVTRGQGGNAQVTVAENGAVTVSHRRKPNPSPGRGTDRGSGTGRAIRNGRL
jgi:hypothetical protein